MEECESNHSKTYYSTLIIDKLFVDEFIFDFPLGIKELIECRVHTNYDLEIEYRTLATTIKESYFSDNTVLQNYKTTLIKSSTKLPTDIPIGCFVQLYIRLPNPTFIYYIDVCLVY